MKAGAKQLLIHTIIALLTAGAATAVETRAPDPPKPSGKVIIIRDTITLTKRNATFDYEGATLRWQGSGDCSQKENMPPIFNIAGSGITVKNCTIVGAPDGIHISAARVTLENISFPDVCEDAITMKKGARWGKIHKCYFAKAVDKAIQCTYGNGHHVHDNVFVDVRVAFRSKTGASSSFYRNRLYRCASGVRADGRKSNTKVWGNIFVFVRFPYTELDRAVIRQLGEDLQVKPKKVS